MKIPLLVLSVVEAASDSKIPLDRAVVTAGRFWARNSVGPSPKFKPAVSLEGACMLICGQVTGASFVPGTMEAGFRVIVELSAQTITI